MCESVSCNVQEFGKMRTTCAQCSHDLPPGLFWIAWEAFTAFCFIVWWPLALICLWLICFSLLAVPYKNPWSNLLTILPPIFLQGELSEAVKALDLGTKAAEAELELASATASLLVKVKVTCRPEPKAPVTHSVGKLKANPLQQKLLGGESSALSSGPSQSASKPIGPPASRWGLF